MKNTVKEVHDLITNFAENAINDTASVPDMSVGDHVRQGDIYVVKVAKDHPHGSELKTFQLVAGSTQGSRHIASGPVSVHLGSPESTAFANLVPGADTPRLRKVFCGPVVIAADRWMITHPEHADIALPAGCYQVIHQVDPRTQSKVRD